MKNILSFRLVISLICQEGMISLNSVLSLTKQTQTYKLISKMYVQTDLKNDLVKAS